MKTSTATINATAWSGFRFDGGGMAWAWLTGDSQVRTHISWMGSEPQFRTSQGAPLKRRAEPISG
jgi:hypothetical protein